MHQLTQQLKSGQMDIVEVPMPQLMHGQILIRNYYSVISAGTEGKTVSDARKGYIAKARSRQKEVNQVIELVRNQGLKSAYDIVINKLEALSPLGYSCAGEIIAVAPDIKDYKPGDFIACAGNSANHADIVAVPKNLCAKVDPSVDIREAAFTAIASVAMQGVRQAELQVGGNCVVIGLGLIGIITMKILEASGIKAIGIDVSNDAVHRARNTFGFEALNRNSLGLPDQINLWSGTLGTDAVIITAATSSHDPVNLAGELCMQKGKVVVVGAVPTGFERLHYYRKELDLRMSCSYGPGRYDSGYEESGIDYPVGQVRWTEQRNMQAVVDLLKFKKLCFHDLISHTFPLINAPEAYNLILDKKEPHLGIILEYDKIEKLVKTIILNDKPPIASKPCVGLIGGGSFAQNIMLPILKKYVNLIGISTSRGNSALYTGKKYNFSFASTSVNEIYSNKEINTVFIFSRHNLHASQTIQSLKASKHIFVEKPIALNNEELQEIKSVYECLPEPRPLIMTGFNRRFSKAISESMKWITGNMPVAINMRVNAGMLPPEHWVNNPETGGGRIIGEACHFIDLAYFIAGSRVINVTALSMKNTANTDDTVNISLKFENGSIANISYFSNGNKKLEKEYIEIFNNQTIIRINDFKSVEVITPGEKIKKKFGGQDKGYKKEIELFTKSIHEGLKSPIAFEDIIHSMEITFSVSKSLSENRTIHLNN
jgi:predicted dehydrogenase/threonine dehydrogenase-like Zn-dependent dehydrogenase